jgi:transposase
MSDNHRVIEEPCEEKFSRTVLESGGSREGVADFNTKCGHNHDKLGGSKTFKCPNCGDEHDRDWGGARNIMIRALRDGSFGISLSSESVAIAYALFVKGCPA